MRKRHATAAGTEVRRRLTAHLASLSHEEIFDFVEQLIPHGCVRRTLRETAISVTGPTLVVAARLGQLLRDYPVEDLFSAELGFLPGPARSEYLSWFVKTTLPPSRTGFFSVETAKLAGLQQLRDIMQTAKLI
jgi:hypothetical protein